MYRNWAPRAGACLLLATTATAALLPGTGWAQVAQRVSFDIKARNTAVALNEFSRQAGVQLMFPYDAAARYRSPDLKGAFSREEALRRLIDGSTLEIASQDAQVITLRDRESEGGAAEESQVRATEVDQLVVTARAGTEAQKRIEASYAISTVSEEKLRLAAPVSLADALKNVPGIYVEAAAGEASNNVRVRGIPTDGYRTVALYEDGLPVQHDAGLDWFNVDQSFRIDQTISRLEVVRGGPSSVFASYAPGGVINFITRRPTDHPEGLLKVEGGDYGYGRADFWVGGPVAGLRVGVGGFYRKDKGVRDPGWDSDKGGQIRLSVGKDFERGSVNFDVKHLDDQVMFWLGLPFSNDEHGNPQPAPGFDPNYDTLVGPESAKFVFLTNVGPFNFDATNGTHVDLDQYTGSLKYELGNGWHVSEGVRYRTSDVVRQALFPNSPFVAGTAIGPAFLASLPASLGAVSTKIVYLNHPNQEFDPVNQNGTGLIEPASAREQIMSLDEVINDVRLLKKFDAGSQSHDVAFGFYYAHDKESFLQRGSQIITDLKPHGELLDVLALNADGDVVQHMADPNGIVRYGSQFEHGLGTSNSYAVYASDEWRLTDKLRVDLGARWEQIDIKGVSEPLQTIDLGLSSTPADNNAREGTGIFVPTHKKFQGWAASVAVNYQFMPNFGAFARYTKGLRLPELSSFVTGPEDEEARVQGINLVEGGLKAQGDNFEVYATLFYSGFDSLAFGETVFDPATSGFISRISFTDTNAYGLELEGVLQPVPWFDVALTATIQEPRFGKFKFTDEDGDHDFSDRLFPRTPRVFLRATPGLNLLDGKLRVQSELEYYGRRFSDAANTQALPGYLLVNGEARYSINDKLTFYAYGTNLTNTIGFDQGNPRAGQIISGDASQKYYLASAALGRTIRVALMYRF